MAVPLRLTVSPERVSAASGDSSVIAVTVRNTSDIVEHYEVGVTGLPEGGSVRSEPDVTKLRPGEAGDVTVHLTVAADPPAPAGEHTLGVVVRSRYRQDVSRCEEVALTIAPIDKITVRVEPEVVTGGRFAHYSVAVTNDGNTPVALRLASTDPERHVAATFQPATLDLLPGASAQSTMSVGAPIPWGREKQRTLKVKADGPGATGEGSATFIQRPRFAPGVMRTAGVLGTVLVLAAAIVATAFFKGNDDGRTKNTDPTTAEKPTASSSSTPKPSRSVEPSQKASSVGPTDPGEPTTEGGQQVPVPEWVPVELRPEGAAAGTYVRSSTFPGITVGGVATETGECSDATAVVVAGDATTGFFLAAAHYDDLTECPESGVQIRFTKAAASAEVTLAGEGNATMRVEFKDNTSLPDQQASVPAATASPQNETTLAADGRDHGGIDNIQIWMSSPTAEPGAQAVGGPQRVRYIPLAASADP